MQRDENNNEQTLEENRETDSQDSDKRKALDRWHKVAIDAVDDTIHALLLENVIESSRQEEVEECYKIVKAAVENIVLLGKTGDKGLGRKEEVFRSISAKLAILEKL